MMMQPRALHALLATTASMSTGPPILRLRPRRLLASGFASSVAQTPPMPHARQLDRWASEGKSKAVLDAYQQMARKWDFMPTVRMENARLRALRLERRYEELIQAVNYWRPTQPRTLLTYHQAIVACGRLQDPTQALRFFAEAKRAAPGGATTETYNLVMDALAKSGQPQEAIELLEELEAAPALRADAISYGSCINAFAQQGDFQQGLHLLERMEAGNVRPNDHVWGALLDACRRGGRLDAALEIWERYIKWEEEAAAAAARPSPLSINAILLNTLIDTCGRVGEWREALRLLEEYEQKIRPGSRVAGRDKFGGRDSRTILYTTAITACADAGQWQVAVKLLQERLLAPSPSRPAAEPDAGVFRAAMEACARARQWGAVQRLYEVMTEEARVAPTVTVCNLVIKSYRWSDAGWSEMLAFLRAMPCRRNAHTYELALEVLAHFQRFAEARALYDELPLPSSAPAGVVVRTARLAAEVLLAYANAERGADALAFLMEMESVGPVPSALCHLRALLACGHAGMVAEAQQLQQGLKTRWPREHARGQQQQGEEMSQEARAKAARMAKVFAKALESKDVKSGAASLVAAVSMLCSVGDWEGAIRLLPRFDRSKVVPNEVVRASLLSTVVDAGQWPVAFYLLEEWASLRRHGLGSSFAALVDALVEAAGDARAEEGALVVRLFGPTVYRSMHAQGLMSHHRPQDEATLLDTITVDLHMQGKVQSVCAVLALLEEMREHYGAALTTAAANQAINGLVLIVGRGRGNKLGVSVLGPYLLDALKGLTSPAFFQPPLRAFVQPRNPGRIVVPRDEVRRYVKK